MALIDPAWQAEQRRRVLRHDWQRYVRPDAERWLSPEAGRALWPELDQQETAHKQQDAFEDRALVAALENERVRLARLRIDLADLKAELKFRRLLRGLKYSPDQPRVPAGNPDGGQWTSDAGTDSADSQPTDISGARRVSPGVEAECEAQYKQDVFVCNAFQSRACFAQATLRYANCLAGLQIPPLNF